MQRQEIVMRGIASGAYQLYLNMTTAWLVYFDR